MLRVTTSMWKIIWGVVRYCDLVVKIKIAKLFSGVFVGDLQKFMLTKISCYTVCAHSFCVYMYVHINWFRRKVLMYTFSVLNLIYDSFLRDLPIF